jgi:hypothetical protein
MRTRLGLAVAAASMWILAGWSYNTLSVACYESRHSVDRQPIVAPGFLGWAIDVAFWPLFTLGAIASPPDCEPVPLAS